jgi:hypothetical protein
MDENQSEPPLSPEDYYMDGPYMVFTAAYHLKRGSCCGSRCRHCPYGLAPDADPGSKPDQRPEPDVEPPTAG